jgi:N-acylneuraminate cytidylyltransferase
VALGERSFTLVALIPARAGSKRLPHKNVRRLAGHPLLAYTIAAARACGLFAAVVVSTDSADYAAVAEYYGATVLGLRPAEYSGDLSPDIEWVAYTLRQLQAAGQPADCFSILRPTSPFRLPQTITRAWQAFLADPAADSLRAVEKARQHPGKMWVRQGNRLLPLLPLSTGALPWHSSQTQMLPEVYAQNASLEIAWSRVALEGNTIAGQAIVPFVTEGYEGLDVNQPLDWLLAEMLIERGLAQLPVIDQAPYPIEGSP